MTEITLEQLLAARDGRQALQRTLLGMYPDKTLIVTTIVAPGRNKRTRETIVAAHAAYDAVLDDFADSTMLYEPRDLTTGYELFLLAKIDAIEAKRRCTDIERRHPLGRLFDIDVIGRDGIPIPRSAVGLPPRRCLLCDDDARVCMRSRRHTTEELLDKIRRMTDEYVRRH